MFGRLDRQWFLDKINSEIKQLENEFQDNCDKLDNIREEIHEMNYHERNVSNPNYEVCFKLRSKYCHRNQTIQKQLKRLHGEYTKYQTMEI